MENDCFPDTCETKTCSRIDIYKKIEECEQSIETKTARMKRLHVIKKANNKESHKTLSDLFRANRVNQDINIVDTNIKILLQRKNHFANIIDSPCIKRA